MFPYNAATRGRAVPRNAPYPPPQVPSFHPVSIERLPQYEWKPAAIPAIPLLLPSPAPINGRKRHMIENGTHVVKRQRIEIRHIVSPMNVAPLCSHHTNKVVTTSSTTTFVGFNPPFTGPHFQFQSQVLAVPKFPCSLQNFTKDKLSCQMVELFEACIQKPVDLERKEICRTRLQQDIQHVFAGGRLYLTGSSVNGLGCRSSDADMCLVIRDRKRPDPLSSLSLLRNVFKSLSYVERIQLIRAKVPILRFKEKGGELECDLNINNTVGIRNTFLLKSYAYADIRIRPLILVVKKWARHHQINDASKGTLSSYTLVLMVLHYLQSCKDPVLPCLQRDYPGCFDPLMELDTVPEGPRNIPAHISRNQSSVGALLLGFLKYYSTEFRWDKQVISVREAKALPKTNSFEWRNKFVCVEEPFERKNVARAVHEKDKFNCIKVRFAESWRKLKSSMDLNSILPVGFVMNKELSKR